MSSFLCFICHSTVNADTNEDTREKYREVVGMHLCPDSHICHICCHVLNKLSLFRAVCLKRSLEYPVLFSEKGTINLQRNDLEFLTLCPEESCGQYHSRNINSKTYNFHYHCENFDDFNQFDQFDNHDNTNNQYVELRDENVTEYFNNEENRFDSDNLMQNIDEIQSNIDDNCVEEYSDDSEANYTQNYQHSDSVDQNYTENDQQDENIEHYEAEQNLQLDNVQQTNENIPNKENPNFLLAHPVNNEIDLGNTDISANVRSGDINIHSLSHIDQIKNLNIDSAGEIYEDKITAENTSVDTDLPSINETIEDVQIKESIQDENLHLETKSNNESVAEEMQQKKKKGKKKKKENEEDKKKKKKYKEFTTTILNLEQQKAELEGRRRTQKYLEAEFKCYNCALEFLFKDTYQAHMMRHEESNGEHKCQTCTLRFASVAVLRAHLAKHAQRHRCTRCGHTVRGRARAAHVRKCGVDNGASCHLCGRAFRDSTALHQHLKRLHRISSSTRHMSCMCGVCATKHDNEAAVRTHMIKHINRKFSCDTCQATFSSPYTLNKHKKRHAATPELHYCVSCNIGYISRKSLLAHQRNSMAHRTTVVECPICSRSCPNHRSLSSHMESVHSNTKDYACPHCPNRYSNRKSLVRHIRSHERVKETRKAVCHLCGSCFKRSSSKNVKPSKVFTSRPSRLPGRCWSGTNVLGATAPDQGTSKLNRHLKEVCEKAKLEEEIATLYDQEC